MAAGVRVIAVDRPGIGKSDPLVGRTVRDWPRDVEALADALGIGRFAVLGFSFGGPYTRACAYALPERITRAGLVSCLGPLDERGAARRLPAPTRWGLAAARLAPLAARPMAWLAARQARGGTMIDQLARSMPRADAEVLSRPDVATALGASLAECFRQGIGAATWDGVAVARGERIPLTAITTEVLLWHGELDRNDPVSMAKLQESRLWHAKARYYPGEGHLIFFSHIDDVLAGLTTDELSEVVVAHDRTVSAKGRA
jgi:pimeloyl-ACP methyl ester carboxylesterase